MGLQEAINGIQDAVGALDGVRKAPDYPPEQLNQFPFAVCWAAEGTFEYSTPGVRKGLHVIELALHVARNGDLPREVALAMPYIETVPDALMADPTLGGTVATIVGPITYEFGPLGYGEKEQNTLGFLFRIRVKIEAEIVSGA